MVPEPGVQVLHLSGSGVIRPLLEHAVFHLGVSLSFFRRIVSEPQRGSRRDDERSPCGFHGVPFQCLDAAAIRQCVIILIFRLRPAVKRLTMGFMTAIVSLLYWTFVAVSAIVLYVGALLLCLVTLPIDPKRLILHRYTCWWSSLYLRCLPGCR